MMFIGTKPTFKNLTKRLKDNGKTMNVSVARDYRALYRYVQKGETRSEIIPDPF